MDTKTFLIVVALVVGGVGGYLIGQKNVPAPHAMIDAMTGMTAGLEGKTGDAFDRAFIDGMIVHHEGAVVMAQQALTTSERPKIKQLAEAIIRAQTSEIEMMRGWLHEWFREEH